MNARWWLPWLVLAGCAAPRQIPALAHARMVSDFETYELHRVGLLPAVGVKLTEQQEEDLQAACLAEFSAHANLEVVRLGETELEAIPSIEPHRLGSYSAAPILALARRYRLDALLVPTVTDLQVHSPQRLGLSMDLLSAETGQALWTASVQLDAAQAATRKGIESWARSEGGDLDDHSWEVTLLSPKRFARFAAFHLASLL